MKFSFSAEQEEFRSNLRRFLAEQSPTKEVRRLMETDAGWERASWQRQNTDLGLTALRIPEAYGGHGFGFGEQGIVLEEMGRTLLCAPYFATTSPISSDSFIRRGGSPPSPRAKSRYSWIIRSISATSARSGFTCF